MKINCLNRVQKKLVNSWEAGDSQATKLLSWSIRLASMKFEMQTMLTTNKKYKLEAKEVKMIILNGFIVIIALISETQSSNKKFESEVNK